MSVTGNNTSQFNTVSVLTA